MLNGAQSPTREERTVVFGSTVERSGDRGHGMTAGSVDRERFVLFVTAYLRPPSPPSKEC